MNPVRVSKNGVWGLARGAPAEDNQNPLHYNQQDTAMNPWKVHAEGWSFEAKDLNVVSASRRRKRAFTGQVHVTKSALPAHMMLKARMIRMGIAIFIAADLFLAFIFLSSVL